MISDDVLTRELVLNTHQRTSYGLSPREVDAPAARLPGAFSEDGVSLARVLVQGHPS